MIDTEVVEKTVFQLSIIIPILNEAATLEKSLQVLQPLREVGCEIIVVDGGSEDGCLDIASPLSDQVISSDKGRAVQMNAGAQKASAPWLLFLHVDTCLPENIQPFLSALQSRSNEWGFFAVRLSGDDELFRTIEWAMNYRSRLTAVATGDQCLFVRKTLFQRCGQFADIPLMEDVAICKELRKVSSPLYWRDPVTTSSRRWEERGIIPTVLLMWRLRLEYFLGVSPKELVKRYYDHH
jgi:rSAM/selenodomain-associated transferase 2